MTHSSAALQHHQIASLDSNASHPNLISQQSGLHCLTYRFCHTYTQTANVTGSKKKRSFGAYDEDNDHKIDYHTSPGKKQKTVHRAENEATWQCELCTLHNKMSDDNCSICSSPKPEDNTNKDNHHHSRGHQNIKKNDNSKRDDEDVKNSEDGNNLSKLISGLKNVRLNANNQSNDREEDNKEALDSMDGLINQLQSIQFDANAQSAMNSNSKMGELIDKLDNMDMNNIQTQIKSINAEINRFILELQAQIYWKYKIKKSTKQFAKMPHRESMDRIISILTFYHDQYNEEYNLFEFICDKESNYTFLENDFKNIITSNVVSIDNIISMKRIFSLYLEYTQQNFPKCEVKTCCIFKRYRDEQSEDDDMFDDELKAFKKKMDTLHSYLFHPDHCGIIVDKEAMQKSQQLMFGGQWFWLFEFDDLSMKWIPYNTQDQMRLNNAWRNGQNELLVGKSGAYRVKFKRSSDGHPFGQQYDVNYRGKNAWRRAVIYGVPGSDGILNGIHCQKNPL